jgi:hypothetical protein
METRPEQLQAELERIRRELDAAREKQRAGDESFRRFSESGIIGIVLVELSGRLLFANDAFLQMTGLTAEALTAGEARWQDLAPPEWSEQAGETLAELQRLGQTPLQEREYLRTDGTRFWGMLTGVKTEEDKAAAFLIDVTQRRHAEEALRRSENRFRFLAEASRILASSLDYQTTLDAVARLVVPILADWCEIRVLAEAGSIRRVAVAHSNPEKLALVEELNRRYPVAPDDRRSVAQVLRTGHPEIHREISDEQLIAGARDEGHLQLLRELDLKSALVFPLKARGRTLGAITLVYADSDRRYGDEEIALAEDLALRAGMAIDNSRLYAEAQAAAQLHQTVEERLTSLTEATGALMVSLSLGRVLSEVLNLSRRLMVADSYAVWRFDRSRNPVNGDRSPADAISGTTAGRWVIAAANGLSERYQSAVVEALQHSAVAPTEPMVVSDVAREPRLAGHRRLLEEEGIRSMLVLPLKVQAAVGGTLVFYYHTEHRFDEIELKVSMALANLAASAIATAELYEAAHRRADQLAEADRQKDQFLAMLAHELRNPLSAISNAIQVTQLAQPGTPAFHRAGEVIERQSRHMARLVDELLDVSRISRGRIELHRQPLDLVELVYRTCEDHRHVLEAAHVSLTMELPEAAVRVLGDPTRLRQAVGNLLENAAKFTDPGGHVTVRVGLGRASTAREPGEGAAARVEVSDTGIGIAPELLPHVFEPFVQADTSLDRARGGLGLGLALVKGIMELHGGRVEIHSEGIGRGTTLAFELPSQHTPVSAEERSPQAAASTEALRVLIVEDNVDSAAMLRDLLELLGHEVEVAYSGPAGVEMARRLRPDVVLCDLGLPGMDGYGVAAALRQDPAVASARLIAVTGYGQEEEVRRSVEAGFEAHLTKPVMPGVLQEMLQSDSGREQSR